MIRKNLYRFIILFVFVCFICLFTGCKNSMNVQTKYVYDDTNYKFGNMTYKENIDTIDIDWVVGDVYIEKNSTESIIVREDMNENTENDYRVHHLVTDNKLSIKFTKSFEYLDYQFLLKKVYIYIPETVLNININCQSSNIEIKDIKTLNININNISGDTNIDNAEIENLKLNNISGELLLFNSIIKNNDINTVSGNIGLSFLELPSNIKIQTTSGTINLYVRNNDSFIIEYESVSGELSSKLAYVKEKTFYNFNNGNICYKIESVSGNLKILEK